ncbi:MAG: dihydrodipicolinate synthase family protein [Betaproteobacteria bacterium]|nr:dihydrodipicolinate synthase family protein [Betaproteobacteria bacterium]
MKPYGRTDAKAYARANLRGVWAATLTPFTATLALDEDGWRSNVRHWYRDLNLAGLFVGGKQGEFYAMSIAERKRSFEIAVDEARAAGSNKGVMISCSDQSMDVVLELANYAQTIGADYIVVHTPLLYFGAHSDDTLFEYYKTIAATVDIGVALWNQPPDCGYTMSPELCMRLAEQIPNIVAIKYSVSRDLYTRLTRLAGDQLIVSCSSEEEWFSNIVELGWQVYLCSSPPYLLQTKHDQRMNQYTALAMAGDLIKAKEVRDSLNPVRDALKHSRPHGKPQAAQKYWQELLGQSGGLVRPPLLQLTDAERAAMLTAFEECGLGRRAAVPAA